MASDSIELTKTCPGCQTQIPATMVICRVCGKAFDDISRMVALGKTVAATKSCPDCAETLDARDAACRFCGYRFGPQPHGAAAVPGFLMPTTDRRTAGDVARGVPLAAGVALLGSLVMAAGSVGPWVDTFLGSISGTHGDGKLTLAAAGAALIATLLLYSAKGGAVSAVLALIAGLAGGAIGAVDLSDVHHKLQGATIFGAQVATVGWGLYAVVVGAAMIVLGVASAASNRR